MTKKIKWGFIGLGNIAHQFAKDLLKVQEAELFAVASRTLEKAENFAAQYGAQKAYSSYQQLMEDSNVDIVYIATPHDSHVTLSVKALEHKKHVLCEKPIALNYQEAYTIIQAARKNQRFFMEAFWTRFNPSIKEVIDKVHNGEIGEVKYINADFAFKVTDPKDRMVNINNGGGSLMDMGVYPLFLSYVILGKPKYVLASSNFFETGADQQTSMILQYDRAQAVLHSSFISPSNMIATISGTEGRINISSIWHETQGYSLIKNNHEVNYAYPTLGKGFTYEIEECHQCILNNKYESSFWSYKNSLELISIVDEVRKEANLRFPSEEINSVKSI